MTLLDPTNPEHVKLMLRLPYAVPVSVIPDFVQDELRERMLAEVPRELRPRPSPRAGFNREQLMAAAAELREAYREDVTRMHANGMSNGAIARALGRSPAFVARILSEASKC